MSVHLSRWKCFCAATQDVAGADLLEEREWDFDEFVRDKLARWTGDEGVPEYAGEYNTIQYATRGVDLLEPVVRSEGAVGGDFSLAC